MGMEEVEKGSKLCKSRKFEIWRERKRKKA